MTSLLGTAVGKTAYAAGFLHAKARRAAAAFRRASRWDWRVLRYGPISLRVPPDWGAIEPDRDGGIVVHNRPADHRVDGDAVWYGSAIELRVYQGEARTTLAPMQSVVRDIGSPQHPITADLRLAAGVDGDRRRVGLAVLKTVRLNGNAAAIRWPERSQGRRATAVMRILPAHGSSVARDFERFGSREWRNEP